MLGVPKRAVPAVRRQLTEWGALPGADLDLAAVLDAAAAENGAAERAKKAKAEHRRQAAARVAEVVRVKEIRARVRPVLDAVLLAVTPRGRRGGTPKKIRVPDGHAHWKVKKAWWLRVKAAVDQTEVVGDPEMLAEFRVLLVRRLVKEGWDRAKVKPASERVLVPTAEGSTAA